ncbi:hypothetical protein NKI74_03005 [Mesorhizobium sp. M0494]|uniref:ABC-three component system middle component 2 n=1 Tax=Mesorhizobium sp. M0494 TaxID=2956951 RepID=UPI003335CBFB
MAQELTAPPSVPLFNSALETGVRSVVLLDAAYPEACDLTRLTWLDHLVVHTHDIGGPASLHPDVPQRTGELLVRRRLVEEGLQLMRRLHMIDTVVDGEGIRYRSREEASALIECMRTSYALALRERADWLAARLAAMSEEEVSTLISDKIGRWAVEFQGEAGPGNGQSL